MFSSQRARQLKAALRALKTVPALLLETEPRLSISLFLLQVFQALVPLAQLWIAKLIIDRLVSALRLPHPSTAYGEILVLVAIELGFALVGVAVREVLNVQRRLLGERLIRHMSVHILAHAQTLDLQMLERPEFYDHLRRIEESAFYRPAALLFQLLAVLQGAVTLLAAALILAHLQPLALPLLLAAAIPYALVQSEAAVHLYTLSTGQTPETRQARYFAHLLSTDVGAKEIRVFGLSRHLLRRYREILAGHERQLTHLLSQRGVRSGISAILPAVVYAGIFAYLAWEALSRQITVGDLTLYIGLVLRSQDALQQMMISISNVIENSLFLDDYRSFLATAPEMPANRGGPRPQLPIRQGVIFEGVTFRYPGSDRNTLTNVSLELGPGETIAIVGENGAGKTTLVKLLARLYDPDVGRITLDGLDLRDLDVETWRQQIAVIFQDFLHYYLTAAENIGFGQIDALNDAGRVAAAARQSGADQVIEGLPRGYASVLGPWFDDGIQLSGGEWQRIALARAFMRDAPILVLDEPTASLDVRAEFEVFNRFRALTRDRSVVLISHRFSNVRLADRIYVLDDGCVVETGTHDELIRHEGRYAELFHLQAAGYR